MSDSPLIASLPTSSAVTASAGWPTTASSATEPRSGVEPSPSSPMPHRATRSSSSSSTRDRGARDREIAVAAGEFLDREAGPPAPHREPHGGQDLVGRQRRLPQAGEELGRRDLACGLATTSPPSSRPARARPRRTPRRGRRARSRRQACPVSGSGSGRCRASTTSAAAPIRPPRRPSRPARAASPPRPTARRRAVRCSSVRRFGRCRSSSRSTSAASRASAPGSARPRGSWRPHRTRRASAPPRRRCRGGGRRMRRLS